MPAERRDQVEVMVGGQVHAGWQRYEIDSSLLIPADAWSVSLATQEVRVPPALVPGAAVKVRVGGETVLVGMIDEISHAVAKSGHQLAINGRDGAGVLVDCSAPIFTAQQVTLDQVIAKILRPLGVTRHRIDAGRALLRERVNTEPGDTAWDMLQRAAQANGLWPWFEPDGELVVGGPRYDTEPVGTLALRRDGVGNNLLSLDERRSIVERYSEVTVLGQASAIGVQEGRHNIRAVLKDAGVPGYRPRLVVDHEATSVEIARAKGSKLISDASLKAYELRAQVSGHRAPNGKLWAAGQRVRLVSEPHGLDGIYFVIARRLAGDRQRDQVTQLTLKEDGVWALYAHPSKRGHRKGRNSLPVRIIDASTGAAP